MKLPTQPPFALTRDVMTLALPELTAIFMDPSPAASALIDRANTEDLNWDEVRHRARAKNLDPRQVWAWLVLKRAPSARATPMLDAAGQPFVLRDTDPARWMLRRIDLHLGGAVGHAAPDFGDEADRQRWLLTSLREEAIDSSLLEGAVATRQEAEEMLRQNRKPRTHGERMVFNNFDALNKVRKAKDQPLTVEFLLDLQGGLTEGTLDPSQADGGGRLRRAAEEIKVWDEEDHQAIHIPPPAEALPARLQRLCEFANAGDDPERFIHPAQKAALLHFWLGYDHPFVDGNGRTARAIFYWSMLRAGYWLVEHVAISTIIRGHPKQYARAYLDSEQPGNDATYFVNYHLRVVDRAIDELHAHLKRKSEEQRRFEEFAAIPELNPRQQALLIRAMKAPATLFTYESHARSHGVVIASARADLLDLEQRGFLIGNRVGRRFRFVAAPDLGERLRTPPGAKPAR